MKLSAPKQLTWIIAVVLGVLSLLSHLGMVPQIAQYQFWMMTIAFGLLAFSTMLKGL